MLFVLLLTLAGLVLARSERVKHEVAQRLEREIERATGLRVSYERVGVVWRRLAVRVEGVEVRHPRHGMLLRAEGVELTPALSTLARGPVRIDTLTVDGAEVTVRFEGNRLLNGPTLPSGGGGGPSGPPQLPFRDVAVNGLHLRVEHDRFGTLDLPSVDVDLSNDAASQRLYVGLLAVDGRIAGAPCFRGVVRRVEAHGVLEHFQTLRLGNTRLELPGIQVAVERARIPLDPAGPIDATATVSGDLTAMTCPVRQIPGVQLPYFRGQVEVRAQGRIDPRTLAWNANAHVRGQDLALEIFFPDVMRRYVLSERAELDVVGDEREGLRVTTLTAEHSGATVTAGAAAQSDPVRITFPRCRPPEEGGPPAPQPPVCPELRGHAEVRELQLAQLFRSLSITEFAKVLWTINASVGLSIDLWRFGGPTFDLDHPAVGIQLEEARVRDWVVLRDYFPFAPQVRNGNLLPGYMSIDPVPIIGISRGVITGFLAINPDMLRFRDVVAQFGPGNRSRAEIDTIRLRLGGTDETLPDLLIQGARAQHIDLSDLSAIAGMPLGGVLDGTVRGVGPFNDPVIEGDATVRGLVFNGLPLGDLATLPGHPWRYRNIRVDAPLSRLVQGQSVFTLRDAFLDFRQFTLRTGVDVLSTRFRSQDYFHMFRFEGDPTFEPLDLRTSAGRTESAEPCIAADQHALETGDTQAPTSAVPAGNSGCVRARVDFVLGRPGDDRDGVMDVTVTGRNLDLRYTVRDGDGRPQLDEHFERSDVRYHYRWLQRRRGFRGARQTLDYVRSDFAGGQVRVGGAIDLGANMHFTATGAHLDLARTARLRGMGVSGATSFTVLLEGTPEAQRWSVDADVDELRAAGRDFGDVRVRVREGPVAGTAEGTGHPPEQRWTFDVDAMDGAVGLDLSARVPWRPFRWRDAEGHTVEDWERSWRNAVLQGEIALRRPMDAVPWLPARFVARLGEQQPTARARVRLMLDELVPARLQDARARLAVDSLELAAQGLRLAQAPGQTLGLCVAERVAWVDPAAATSAAACARTPELFSAQSTVPQQPPPFASFLGPEGIELQVSGGGGLSGALALDVRATADLARLARIAPGVTQASGSASLGLHVGGTTANPSLSGSLRAQAEVLALAAVPSPLNDLELRVRLEGSEITLDAATARFGSGRVDLSGGTAHLAGRSLERLDIPVRLRGLTLQPQPGVDVSLDAETRLVWNPGERLPALRGDVNLGRVQYTRPINMSQDISGNAQLGGGGSGPEVYDPANDNLRLDLLVHARQPLRVVNNLIDAEVRIDETQRPFHVVGTDGRVGVTGSLVVPRGRLSFRGVDYDVRRGRVEFDSAERVAPSFDLLALTELRRSSDAAAFTQWRISLHAYGTPERFALDMSSDPTLSREDIALLLTYRMTRAEMDAAGAGNLGQTLAVEALTAAFGVDRIVRNAIPLIDDFRLGSAYSPAQGRSVPQVSVGRRITDWLRVGATVNTTDQREVRATADFRIDRGTSFQFGYDNIYSRSTQFGNLGGDFRWRLDFE